MVNDAEFMMTTKRVQALTDGIYAIAMTILVLNLKVPVISSKSSASLLKALMALQPKFYNYVLSFLLLSVFWTIHHRHFHFIKKTDSRLIWINIFSLLFVVLLPFSTSLYSEYQSLTVAAIFFELNIFIIGMFKYFQWTYATGKESLVIEELEHETIFLGKKLNLVTPVVSLFAIGIAFFSPDWSTLAYISVPLIISRIKVKNKTI